MPEKIYILTGPIQCGKTTRLMQWSEAKKNVFGILTPVLDGKRSFMNVHTRERFEMEAGPGEKNILTIGKFIFSKNSFEKATGILKNAMKEKNGWLIIDEIGPLELKGEGFNVIVKKILSENVDLNILFVVRDTIMEQVMQHYGLASGKVIIVNTGHNFFVK